MNPGVCYCGAYGGGAHTLSARCKPVPPAVVTDLQRLDARLSAAAHHLKYANEELHRAEIAHRQAREAVEAELARLAPQSDTSGAKVTDYLIALRGTLLIVLAFAVLFALMPKPDWMP